MIKKFIKYYKPYKKLFFLDLVFAFIAAACDLVYPVITKNLINDSIPNKNFRMLWIFAGVLLFIYLIKVVCNYFMNYWGHALGVRMQGDMRETMFSHLQKLPCKFFDNNKTGDIMSRVINDLMEISELAHHGPEDLFISCVMILGSFIILCTINIWLTLIIFAFLPFMLIFTWKKRSKMRNAFTESRVKTGEINANLENSISGIKVSKAFNSNEYEYKKFIFNNEKFKVAREKAYKVMAEYFSGIHFCTDILDYVSIIFGGLFTFTGRINIGDFMAYILYIKLFTQPIRRLIMFMEQYQNGMSGFKRFLDFLEERTEDDKNNNENLNIKGDIEFSNVSFKYEDKTILDNMSLNIENGKMIALVGPSGAGKTTFCNLIPRFYEATEGEILLDGHDIRDIGLKQLRENIGIVQQDVFLFTGTIKENILYGKQNATDEEIINASKLANIHEFIITLKDGYDTFIGERGVKLSGGQKQRLALSRVFLKDPKILILDEATSALDNSTENLIQKSIQKLCKGRTTIIVAHRLSTIKNADEIIVMTDEGIKERGNHEKLIKDSNIYKRLYNLQFSK